jgi:hypothetical protein
MSTDRSIRLDVSVPDLGARAGEGFASGSGGQGAADSQARERFDRAFAPPAPPPADTEAAQQIPKPFSLFGSMPAEPDGTDSTPETRLDELLDRLMVDDGSGGKQVRMDLKDDVLPGVSIVIQEAEGRLQVDFICRAEASRLRLNAALPGQAPQLAQRLERDVLLRVQTDDPEDPCLFEVSASPGGRTPA